MDASPCRITDLITATGTRLVIPVFQRPYFWEEEISLVPSLPKISVIHCSSRVMLPRLNCSRVVRSED
ncbi:MAG: hypothetical protein IKF14_13970 [Atopobiaceae bacterium]|nr:hypothetical protein [Atopobiaceae bacterium]